jgi:hypothetical protein
MPGGDAFFKHTNNYCIQVQVVMPVRQSKQVHHGRPLTSSESEEVKIIVAKHLEEQKAETEALNKKIAELTHAEAVAKLQSGNTTQIQSAGGNKRKKTKRVKRTKSTKRQNKKTRVVKQRGGGNKYFNVIETNLPYIMTITKAIDGTKDTPLTKKLDCICEPDAYQNPVKTFECAKEFALRQNLNPQVKPEDEQAAVDAEQTPIPEVETEAEQAQAQVKGADETYLSNQFKQGKGGMRTTKGGSRRRRTKKYYKKSRKCRKCKRH